MLLWLSSRIPPVKLELIIVSPEDWERWGGGGGSSEDGRRGVEVRQADICIARSDSAPVTHPLSWDTSVSLTSDSHTDSLPIQTNILSRYNLQGHEVIHYTYQIFYQHWFKLFTNKEILIKYIMRWTSLWYPRQHQHQGVKKRHVLDS